MSKLTTLTQLGAALNRSRGFVANWIGDIAGTVAEALEEQAKYTDKQVDDVKTALETHTHPNATTDSAGLMSSSDKLWISNGAVTIGMDTPSETDKLWIDTGNGGIIKYYNGSAWVAASAVWG